MNTAAIAAEAARSVLRLHFGSRAFVEPVEDDGGGESLLVLGRTAQSLAQDCRAVRESGLTVLRLDQARPTWGVVTCATPLHVEGDPASFVADDLLLGEDVGFVWTPSSDSAQRPVVVGHDFSERAPFQTGWLHWTRATRATETRESVEQMPPGTAAEFAAQLRDTGYRRGAKTMHRELDCSGFVYCYVLATKGLRLPRLARWQELACDPISEGQLMIDDLVFFARQNTSVEHVGIVCEVDDKRVWVAHSSFQSGGPCVEDLSAISAGRRLTVGRICGPRKQAVLQ